MRVYTLSDMRSEKKLRVYTASEAKGLTGMCTTLHDDTISYIQSHLVWISLLYIWIWVGELHGVITIQDRRYNL